MSFMSFVSRFYLRLKVKMIIARLIAVSVLACVFGYSWPAKADVIVLRCVGGPPPMPAFDPGIFV
jgi:hypothetical protein